MVQLRIMNALGIKAFALFLADAVDDPETIKPNLNTSTHSDPFPLPCDIVEMPQFQTNLDLARYLLETFTNGGITRENITSNVGLWTWLGYFWFEFLTQRSHGVRQVRKEYNYVLSDDFKRRYRHLIWLPYDAIARHGEMTSLLLLYSKVGVQPDYIEQIGGRLDLYSNSSVVGAATLLYMDRTNSSAKRGTQGDGTHGGGVRRFATFLQQIRLTYDLYSLTQEEIISLLPTEFEYLR